MLRRILIACLLIPALLVPLARADEPVGSNEPPPPATEPPPTTEPPPPTTEPPPLFIPDGVSIEGISVGGMTAEQAKATVQAVFDVPVRFRHKRSHWSVVPETLGAEARVDGAVARALAAPPGSTVDLVIVIRGRVVRDYVAELDRLFSSAPKDAVLRLVKLHPRITDAKRGFSVEKGPMKASIVYALFHGERGPLVLEGKVLRPKVTRSSLVPVIVIHRGSNRLVLYKGEKLWRKFGVATGQAAYPTPLGRYDVVVKWKNPWWYPPPSPWAKGEKPIPPGPGNPLGTRWMGLSAPAVGIHGTPDAASIGYSASHGCIRMRIPDAEWLFDHVKIGTTVFIVPA